MLLLSRKKKRWKRSFHSNIKARELPFSKITIQYSYLWIILPKGLCNKAKEESWWNMCNIPGILQLTTTAHKQCTAVACKVWMENWRPFRDSMRSHLFSLSTKLVCAFLLSLFHKFTDEFSWGYASCDTETVWMQNPANFYWYLGKTLKRFVKMQNNATLLTK